ncbi:HpcH/HpaI aldolase/citrate lyase family protein [Azospirillum ramasamyi]|uniref:ATP-binding protein n=1 Tax=Azospirillum ramasamyi TaxID=682998 RepID=A0A2U9S8G0_9PROT|nr:HpcH/HpaI aldolase/citrate lyase family protein [Azospirillum ramasamyi]AWU95267.1 ATP-binding protein [Azospirillum ramasamyi]
MAFSYLNLGASLYVPATRHDLVASANGDRLPRLRSVILCTEDSILEGDVEMALANLRQCLPQLRKGGPLVFIRPRSPNILARILSMPGVERVHGFVLPKSTRDSVRAFSYHIPASSRFVLMPTLETREAFDPFAIAELRTMLSESGLRERVLALRIGGNDILNLLGIRRSPGRTIYDTAAGPVVASLVAAFRPFGFPLTAPVFDDFSDADALRVEVRRDLEHGLVGKTAIHPSQVSLIEQEYRVSEADFRIARRILDDDAPAVFQIDKVMCEPATHANWAARIMEQAAIYGTATDFSDSGLGVGDEVRIGACKVKVLSRS